MLLAAKAEHLETYILNHNSIMEDENIEARAYLNQVSSKIEMKQKVHIGWIYSVKNLAITTTTESEVKTKLLLH